ncbi:outer membrane beta-barrel protein [Pontimicrobium aquaticum]|uniref:Uncharacterized protein n=1 Tax=Pontimicrobium aquaticum TaxID=2565367 RepID=A0A4U0ESR6_9FLAO|nr:outer membrane beta-barrel protein [Pontimicrobium aquaticum]TJY34793.1 hypothetical protein E5167_10830 [Pontimicrobium aquaticum]
MKNKQLTLLVALSMLFVTITQAQHKSYDIKNGFGIGGGISLFNIKTDNFTTTKGNGFIVALAATVDIPNRWYTVSYGMQISENTFEISGRMTDLVAGDEQIEYKLMAAQLGFLFHGKIIGNNFTIDVGPQLQYNGDLEFKNSQQESYYINGYDNLSASDITEMSKFNINGAIGATAGFGPLRLRAQYIYGFLNMFEKLNDNLNEDVSFKGNPETIMFTALFTF